MTQRQIELVQSSFAALAPRADELSQTFYDTLFDIAPAVRAMFPLDISEQKDKLVHMLGFIVNRLHVATEIARPIENLGVRHVAYGAQAEHYPIVGQALMTSLEKLGGDVFTAETRDAWAAAFDLLSTRMIEAGQRSAAV